MDADEAGKPDFDFRLSMLPPWAQRAALSRPSMAEVGPRQMMVSDDSETAQRGKTAEGKWAEVSQNSHCVVVVIVVVMLLSSEDRRIWS